MTSLTLPRPARESRGGLRAVFRFLADLAAGIQEGHAMAARYERLRYMSDAELARLGLTRDQVPAAALHGVKGL